MSNPTTTARESELVTRLARHAYPTAEAVDQWTLRALGCKTMDLGCEVCRYSRKVGYITSGPYAGEDLWVCEAQEGR